MQLQGYRKSLAWLKHIYLKRQRNQFYLCSLSILLIRELLAFWAFTQSVQMATKVKGICKYITNIFVVKERELEIGGPTDVKHVAHIGWEGHSGGTPTWMKAFKAGPDFAATSIGHSGSAISPWSSQGGGGSARQLTTTSNVYKTMTITSDVTSPPKKHKRRKPKSTSSPKSSSSSTLRSSRATNKTNKHKAKVVEGNHNTPAAIEVS